MIKYKFSIKYLGLAAIFLLGLSYVATPEAPSIQSFAGLPNSVKSDLPGDTWQNPNIAAYFSDYERPFVTRFYFQEFRDKFWLGKLIPPVLINHPPEDAYTYIRDQQESSFLEEYLYPLRGSLFVNGFEPVVNKNGQTSRITDYFAVGGGVYASKTTIRYYPSPLWAKVGTYLGIWAASYLLIVVGKKALGGFS